MGFKSLHFQQAVLMLHRWRKETTEFIGEAKKELTPWGKASAFSWGYLHVGILLGRGENYEVHELERSFKMI